ncbi:MULTISPECIES: hypothetical protein [Bartonella]|uniref:hypothetical protein n=1 Tax=Bartonella TaxID=773 RepID=UPI0002E0DE9E|nr:hypothetical protein [Bartonella grahamii]
MQDVVENDLLFLQKKYTYNNIYRDMLSAGGENLITGRLKNKGIVHKNWGRVLGYVF